MRLNAMNEVQQIIAKNICVGNWIIIIFPYEYYTRNLSKIYQTDLGTQLYHAVERAQLCQIY